MLKKILLVILVLVLARMSIYTVDAAEYAYVTVLGRHEETFDGNAASSGAGLHVGWPWPIQSVQRLDRRLQLLDVPAQELLTYDATGKSVGENLTVEAYATWKIAGPESVDRFIQKLGSVEQAQKILANRIAGDLGALVPQMPVDDLISTQAGIAPGMTRVDEAIDKLQTRLMASLKGHVLDAYGIELVDVRLLRFNHPAKVRPEIFERIRSERRQKAAKYLADGDFEARKIDSTAEREVREKLAQARFEEEKLKGQADSEAMLIRNQANSLDPEFYAFLKKMEKLQSILGDNRTVLLLSTHRPLFDLLFSPPRADGKIGPAQDKKDKKSPGGS